MIGAYPGTFDPPTVGHLAVAEAAWRQGGLDRVDLVVSRVPLGKAPAAPSLEHRIEVLESVAATRPWLGVVVTDARLIGDIAAGYDAIILGVDKWIQVCDPVWYDGSSDLRDAVVAALPRVLLATRRDERPFADIPEGGVLLETDEPIHEVSSTEARAGRLEWIVEEAADFDARTGAWSDPDRYLRSLPD